MQKLLIIAQSGRMLAQATHNIGLKPIVIDCFADEDTQNLAFELYQVKSLAIQDIKNVIESLQANITKCIYGSGFESHPESLFFLEKYFELLGNSAHVFKALLDKQVFFKRLDKLAIKFPSVYFPTSSEKLPPYPTLLKKSYFNQGGLGVEFVENNAIDNEDKVYYQHYLDGETLSVLFSANGQNSEIIGFNTQWTQALSHLKNFIFSGIINHSALSNHHQKTLTDWVNKLTLSYQLKGLNSLDFILYHDECYVLEINPRPPASMQLYDDKLLNTHLGIKNSKPSLQTTAYQIIYAPKNIKIPNNINWLESCCDLPAKQTIIPKGQPICSIIARHKNAQSLLQDLREKQQFILNQLI